MPTQQQIDAYLGGKNGQGLSVAQGLDSVNNTFAKALGRLPSASDANYYSNLIQGGGDINSILSNIQNSPEAKAFASSSAANPYASLVKVNADKAAGVDIGAQEYMKANGIKPLFDATGHPTYDQQTPATPTPAAAQPQAPIPQQQQQQRPGFDMNALISRANAMINNRPMGSSYMAPISRANMGFGAGQMQGGQPRMMPQPQIQPMQFRGASNLMPSPYGNYQPALQAQMQNGGGMFGAPPRLSVPPTPATQPLTPDQQALARQAQIEAAGQNIPGGSGA